MKFSDVLASTIHDIKNSMGMIINTLEELTSDPDNGLAENPEATALQLEARRVNNGFIKLLTLYKLDEKKLSLNVAEQNLEEFLDDILAEHRNLAQIHGIQIDCECAPELMGYFDEDLVRGVVNNALDNAQRYTKDRLLLKAEPEADWLVIRVEDNGQGFPAAMLDMQTSQEPSEGFKVGNTQLGLYFSTQIARLHQNRERSGFIRLENARELGGGCFSIWLP